MTTQKLPSPLLPNAPPVVGAEDDVVEDFDAEELAGARESDGHFEVGGAGGGIP